MSVCGAEASAGCKVKERPVFAAVVEKATIRP